jgi:hypothetical protein
MLSRDDETLSPCYSRIVLTLLRRLGGSVKLNWTLHSSGVRTVSHAVSIAFALVVLHRLILKSLCKVMLYDVLIPLWFSYSDCTSSEGNAYFCIHALDSSG